MKKNFAALLILLLASCMDADFENQDLCASFICGEPMLEQVNITVYNNTSVDFEEIIWSIGGKVDTINVLAFDQFSCWVNYDTVQTNYIFAHGIADDSVYISDSLFIDTTIADTITAGNYLIRLTLAASDKLAFSLVENYSVECIAIN
ncbi:MAG: hypothetical protein ACI9C9_002015 [Marivirga sp.]|jgi:hypothetical protein